MTNKEERLELRIEEAERARQEEMHETSRITSLEGEGERRQEKLVMEHMI